MTNETNPIEGITMKEWIHVNNLPTENMKVKWLCKDGIEDIGFYYHQTQTFASFELSSESEITHWKPF